MTIDHSQLSPRMEQFLDLWDGKRAGRTVPARYDFAFEELRPWLGALHLLEVLPGDFRFKVFATGTAERVKREYTGRLMSEAEPKELTREAMAAYRQAVDTRAPLFTDRSNVHIEGRAFSWRRLILPLGVNGETVDHLFVCIEFLL
jgi:hypothetical protein